MRNYLLGCFAAFALSGCAVWEQFKDTAGLIPETAEIEVQISTDKSLNVRPNGLSSPAILRVYELSSPVLFRSLDFFSLFENDKAALGDEYIKRYEYQLEPGQDLTEFLKLQPETRAVGFAVAFREINGTSWRTIHTVEERKSYFLDVKLKNNVLAVEHTQGVEQIYF
ncbi:MULTISPECIES: type VI secretion system lipoprotein TssJ [unclassified Photobacterium]|uniref:type VI secretion system lipoprotein TssJ n=1 Tax=unclassified Photobacterium TaxID=2628852 RepID=UPI001B8B3984|nr:MULTISPECIES: type VI secretion system lipoprotein TssJ [unclassified Photobacterium]MDO6708568.1 type VI secretion system lipoprotein TssJ [Photobacterium sp. 1_MG-2023]QUJ70032.1 type VI secretion system lipoprotein TssJ [Photobacterium sp. GJ3]